METIAFKGHEDSPKVIKFIKDYADYEKMYEKALEKKIWKHDILKSDNKFSKLNIIYD